MDALDRLRVVRRDGYRCQWRGSPPGRPCSTPAPEVGILPGERDRGPVALCRDHYAEGVE